MDVTPTPTRFQEAYLQGTPPWVIDEPQPAVVDLERSGGFRGAVLDVGCGTGEHTVHLARLGHDVLGVDVAPAAIQRARDRAAALGVPARFEVADVMDPAGLGVFDTVLDSALFHIFDPGDRQRYARALLDVCAPDGTLTVLGLAEGGPAFGPTVGEEDIRGTFTGPAWSLEELSESTYRGVVGEEQSERLGVPAGGHIDLPAWLARVRRTAARP